MERKPSSSWFWKGLLSARPIIARGHCFLVGSGSSIRTWSDPWVPGLPLYKPCPLYPVGDADPQSLVQDFIIPSTTIWNQHLLEQHFDRPFIEKILQIHLPSSSTADRAIWLPADSGQFSVKSAYDQIFSNRLAPATFPLVNWKKLWNLDLHDRLKVFLWKIAWDILPTRQHLAHRLQTSFVGPLSSCPLCEASEECLQHLLYACSYTRLLWRLSPWPLSVTALADANTVTWVTHILDPVRHFGLAATDAHNFKIYAMILTDSIWRVRNQAVHNNAPMDPLCLSKQIFKSFREHSIAWSSAPRLRKKKFL